MLNKFKSYLAESIRQGLPHISTMSYDQIKNLTKGGRVHLHHVTEKTDGSTFMVGHDQEGFYTQSSGSGKEKMRKPEDYTERVRRRAEETGKEPEYTGAKAFADAHEALQKNEKLVSHLRSHAQRQGGETQLRGELFSRKLSRPSEDKEGEVKLVGTSYNPSSWGKRGKIVIHTKLPENQSHDVEHFKKNLSDDEINFDDDKIEHKPSHVDVSEHSSRLNTIDHELLRSRTTPKNKEAKQAEEAKLDSIRKSISDKVDEHVKSLGIRPKFGSGTEGAVVHPSEKNPDAPRFKITSDTFRAYKADPTNKEKFKKRTLAEMSLLREGGNIKVKTPEGEVSAAPFKVSQRSQQKDDAREALSDIHHAFHQEHGEHLFGKNQKGLRSGSIFGGSTRQFMDDKIGDDEFKKHKPTVGDFDVQVAHDHKDKLSSTMKPGRKFGKYTVVGMKKHGNENSAVMRHENGEHHQFDFEGTDYEGDEPTKASQFLHSSDWEDTKAGIKGAHHKILLNATGGDTHKFSITHGLRSRTDESDKGTKEPEEVSRRLFGDDADHSHIHSFLGVSHLIKKHIPKERHQEIYDKFKSGLKSVKADNGPALEHLRKTLGVKDDMNEETENAEGHHASVVPLVGFSPFSHMGHAQDLGGALKKLPGKKHIGISSKAEAFSPEERGEILNRQWGKGEQSVHVVKGAGETIRRAYDSLPEGRRHLHILVGHDRKGFAESLKKALEADKIKEMESKKFDSVHLHYPEDTDRSHGMSGTKMRRAASEGNLDEFHRHLGPSFTKSEAKSTMKRVKDGIDSGNIKLVREEFNSDTELNHEKFGPMLDTFIKFASNKLGVKSLPTHELKKDEMSSSFAAYSPSEKHVIVVTKNRHPMDIFRSVAHELVHHKQNEDGRLGKNIEQEGATGSDIENEANSEAGKIMRWFAKENPVAFKSGYVVESYDLNEGINDPSTFVAVFLAGGPGSGKDYVMKQTLDGHGLQEVNSDVAFEFLMQKAGLDFKMPESERMQRDIVRGRAKAMTKERQRLALVGRRGVIINGTGDDSEKIATIKKELEDLGYKSMLVFVNTSNEVSKKRNVQRGKIGGREVPEDIRLEKWMDAQRARPTLKKMFGEKNFIEVDNSYDLRSASQDIVDKVLGKFNEVYKMVRKFVRTPVSSQSSKEWKQTEIEKRNMQAYVSPRATTMSADRGPAKIIADPSTQGNVDVPTTDELNLARRMGLSYYGFGRYGRSINGKHTVTHVSQDGKIVPKQNTLNEDLRKWFKEKWVRFDTKGNIKGDCARESGEGKPKCRPLASAVAMGKEARAKAARRKRREDPVANREGKGNKPVFVKTNEETLLEKNMPTNPSLWSKAKSMAKQKFDVYPSAYANGWAAKWYKSKGGGWKSVSESVVDEACWDGYKRVGMKKKGNRMVPNCVKVDESTNTPSDREWGTNSLAKIYRDATPGQNFPENPLFEKKKMKLKKMKEDNNLPVGGLPVSDGVGPMFTRARSPAYMGYTADIQESIIEWASQEHVIERYINKYGTDAEKKLLETMTSLNESFFEEHEKGPKYFTHLRESWDSRYGGRDMGTVHNSSSKEEMSEQGSFGSAFTSAREAGNREFEWRGKKYTSLKKGETELPSSQRRVEPKSEPMTRGPRTPEMITKSDDRNKQEPAPMSRGPKTPEMVTKSDDRNRMPTSAQQDVDADKVRRETGAAAASAIRSADPVISRKKDTDPEMYKALTEPKGKANIFTGSRHGDEGIDEDLQKVNRRENTAMTEKKSLKEQSAANFDRDWSRIQRGFRGVESGTPEGNYSIPKPRGIKGTASGAYAFTNSTWRQQLRQQGRMDDLKKYPNAYKAPPELQDDVMRTKTRSNYIKQGGDENPEALRRAMNIHYTGNAEGRMTRKQLETNRGTTSDKYWTKFQRNMGTPTADNSRSATSATRTSSSSDVAKRLSAAPPPVARPKDLDVAAKPTTTATPAPKPEVPKVPEAPKTEVPKSSTSGAVIADPNKDFGDQVGAWMQNWVDGQMRARQQRQQSATSRAPSARTNSSSSGGALSPEPTKKPQGPDMTLGSQRTLRAPEPKVDNSAQQDDDAEKVRRETGRAAASAIRSADPVIQRMDPNSEMRKALTEPKGKANIFTGSRYGDQGIDEDWQKVNRQDKTDGLSQKAVNAYRRENPGSKLSTAVTEKNPTGKRAKRRLSFCRRMGGMKERLTSAKTARDPDSRINKALRRWNCEE